MSETAHKMATRHRGVETSMAHFKETLFEGMADSHPGIGHDTIEVVAEQIRGMYGPTFDQFVQALMSEAAIVQPSLAELEAGDTPIIEALRLAQRQLDRLDARAWGETVRNLQDAGFSFVGPDGETL